MAFRNHNSFIALMGIVFTLLLYCDTPCAQQPTAEPAKASTQAAKIYRNPAERREAGLGTAITDWLRVAGLAELEKEYSQLTLNNHNRVTQTDDPSVTLQLGSNLHYDDWLEAQFVLEMQYDKHYYSQLDEAFVGIDSGDIGVKIGKQYLPFGHYFSYFVSGPMLEIGETRSNAIVADFSITEKAEWTLFTYDAKLTSDGSKRLDWGTGIDLMTQDEALRFGVSYISELVNFHILMMDEYPHPSNTNLPAWSAYALIGMGDFELTLELVQALRHSESFATKRYKPIASSFELAIFPTTAFQLALRLGYSDELIAHPQWQTGASITWAFTDHYSLSLDYLYGKYKLDDLADDEASDHQQWVAGLLIVEF